MRSELCKAVGEAALGRMHRICVAIWETGEWPEEWAFFTFIPLPKKGDLKQCANYRTIPHVSHASKILLQIILERIRVAPVPESIASRGAKGVLGGHMASVEPETPKAWSSRCRWSRRRRRRGVGNGDGVSPSPAEYRGFVEAS